MKVWLVALMFLVPLAFSAGAVEYAADQMYDFEDSAEATDDAPVVPGEPLDVPTWIAIMVGWVGILVVEVRMNEGVRLMHQKIDKLERYVNTRDNLLALRIDELDGVITEAAEDSPRERRNDNRDDDWKPQRRH